MKSPSVWLWEQISGNFLWWLCVNALVYLSTMYSFIKQRISDRHFHSLMRSFLGGHKEVPIVLAEVHPESILLDPDSGDSRVFKIPSHASYVGMQEAIALVSLQKKLELVFPRKKFPIVKAGKFQQDLFPVFFSVGGFIANRITRSVLRDKKVIDGIMLDMEKVIIDDTVAHTAHCSVERPDFDEGFVVITGNPFHRDGRCCLLFGCWAQGSQAAIEYLMKPIDRSPNGRKFLDLGKRSNLFSTVKTELDGGLNQKLPSLTYVRKAARRVAD